MQKQEPKFVPYHDTIPPLPPGVEIISLEEQQRVIQYLKSCEQTEDPTTKIYNDALAFIKAKKENKNSLKGPIYVAGPMSGYKDHNFPLFNQVSAILRADGWYVLNPAENNGGVAHKDYAVCYRADIRLVDICEAIVFLPDWQKSSGAVGEFMLGDRLNKTMFEFDAFFINYLRPLKVDSITYTPFQRNQKNETVLQEADRLVAHDRQNHYGHPFDDFSRTANLWSAAGFKFLDARNCYREIQAEDIAIAMMLLKLSRIVNSPKRDSIVDTAGYAKTLDMVIKMRKQRSGIDSTSGS